MYIHANFGASYANIFISFFNLQIRFSWLGLDDGEVFNTYTHERIKQIQSSFVVLDVVVVHFLLLFELLLFSSVWIECMLHGGFTSIGAHRIWAQKHTHNDTLHNKNCREKKERERRARIIKL